jgi:hypothetical protein
LPSRQVGTNVTFKLEIGIAKRKWASKVEILPSQAYNVFVHEHTSFSLRLHKSPDDSVNITRVELNATRVAANELHVEMQLADSKEMPAMRKGYLRYADNASDPVNQRGIMNASRLLYRRALLDLLSRVHARQLLLRLAALG